MLQDDGCCGEGFQQVGELDHHHGLRLGQWHEPELGFEHNSEGSLRADYYLGEVHGLGSIGELVQVVAADAPENLRIAAVDLRRVLGGETQHGLVARGFGGAG